MSGSGIRLRPYQTRAIEAVRRGFNDHVAQMLVMPTGTGKTTVFAAVARDWPGRVLILEEREELLQQSARRVAEYCGIPVEHVGVERAAQTIRGMILRPRFVVGSVPTLRKAYRLRAAFPPDSGPWLVIVDECHHAVNDGYATVMGHMLAIPGTRVLGVTATPARADKESVLRVFPHLADHYGLPDAIADGWLTPVEQRRVVVEGLDFSQCRRQGGDFHAGDLERALMGGAADAADQARLQAELDRAIKEETPLHKVVAVMHKEVADRPTLVFCVTVKHAQAVALMLDRYRKGSAVALSGKTDDDTRARAVGRFLSGDIQFLVNVGLFLEGFDAPNASCVVMARPTKSLPLYTQVVGRILRPLKGVVDWAELADDPEGRRNAIARSRKPYALVLDFAGNAGQHRIADAVELLHGDCDDDVKERARRIIQEGDRPVPVREAVEEARDDVALLLDQEVWRRRRHIKAEADYRTESVELVGGGHAHAGRAAVPARKTDRAPGDGPTPGQVRHLLWLGVAPATIDGYTKRQASAVISSIRKSRGLPEGRP